MKFFIAMKKPPTITHQEKKATVVNGRPKFYEPPELKQARATLMAYLARYKPDEPLSGPVALTTNWIYPESKSHPAGTWKITKPDTDNMVKLLKDCMTAVGFWKDDAQVAWEIIVKMYGKQTETGIMIQVTSLKES